MPITTDPNDIELLPESGDPKPTLNTDLEIIQDHLVNGELDSTTTIKAIAVAIPDSDGSQADDTRAINALLVALRAM